MRYNNQLERQYLKQKTLKELVAIVIGVRENLELETITVSKTTYYVDRDALRLTTKDNAITMDMVRYLCRVNDVPWRKKIPDTYKIETSNKTSDELMLDLKANGIPLPTHFVKKNLVHLATKHSIPIKKTIEKGVVKTWLHQPKGMLQVAWERGLLDFFTLRVYRLY